MNHKVTPLYFITFLLSLSFCSTKKHADKTLEEGHSGHSNMEETMVHFTTHEQLVANIKIDTVKESKIGDQVTLLGRIVPDEKNTSVVSSRLKGRIDTLFVRNPGQEVRAGQ